MSYIKSHITNISIALVFFFSVWLSGNLGGFDQQHISDDLIWYHSYAPALFVKHDLKLNFYKDSADYYSTRHMYSAWMQENGNPVIKTTCGQSIMFLPFTAWVFIYYSGEKITGYEVPFSAAICISTLVYFLLALVFIKKILRHFSFSEGSIALTIICLGLGTNILSYTSTSWGTPHISDFFLLSCFMYLLLKWFESPKMKYSILMGVCFGMLVLIRPTNILFGLIILFYGVRNVSSFKQHLKFLLGNSKQLVMIALTALLVFSPQLFYWKYVTGNWVYFSYVGEQFFYSNPHLIEYIFGFRKGWLIYSPLILLAMFGLFFKAKNQNSFFFATVLIVLSMLYLNSAWWCWWFGGCFGARSMIEVYPLLAIGFCNFFEHLNFKKMKLVFASSFLAFLILHNIKSSYLARINVIHYDSMTFKAYKYLFFKIKVSPEEEKYIQTLLVHPDYEKAQKGIDT